MPGRHRHCHFYVEEHKHLLVYTEAGVGKFRKTKSVTETTDHHDVKKIKRGSGWGRAYQVVQVSYQVVNCFFV